MEKHSAENSASRKKSSKNMLFKNSSTRTLNKLVSKNYEHNEINVNNLDDDLNLRMRQKLSNLTYNHNHRVNEEEKNQLYLH